MLILVSTLSNTLKAFFRPFGGWKHGKFRESVQSLPLWQRCRGWWSSLTSVRVGLGVAWHLLWGADYIMSPILNLVIQNIIRDWWPHIAAPHKESLDNWPLMSTQTPLVSFVSQMVAACFTFGALLTNPIQLYLPTLIPKWRDDTKGVSRRQCLLLRSSWKTINFRTLRVVKDQQRHRRPFVISTRRRVCQRSSPFAVNLSLARCKKLITCCTTSLRSRHLQINFMAWRYLWKMKILWWLCLRVCHLIWTFDHDLDDDADGGVDYRVHDSTFDAQDVEDEGKWILRWWYCNDIASMRMENSSWRKNLVK